VIAFACVSFLDAFIPLTFFNVHAIFLVLFCVWITFQSDLIMSANFSGVAVKNEFKALMMFAYLNYMTSISAVDAQEEGHREATGFNDFDRFKRTES
jgi:hypothetical protein